ncbi:hypothetical protein M0804_009042 [Polistes exclamans]|nr:hypothetical protein M0804_009042 [Polistes exclamans]
MATVKLTLYNAERDILVDMNVSAADAQRASTVGKDLGAEDDNNNNKNHEKQAILLTANLLTANTYLILSECTEAEALAPINGRPPKAPTPPANI